MVAGPPVPVDRAAPGRSAGATRIATAPCLTAILRMHPIMNDTTSNDQQGNPRARMRELLAIPERDRTDAQWDELAELELRLAPGNRIEPARRADAPPPRRPMGQPSRGRPGPGSQPSGRRSKKQGR